MSKFSGFKLISKRPWAVINLCGRWVTDIKKPFVFPVQYRLTSDMVEMDAVWHRDTYECADDICYIAHKVGRHMEAKAGGLDICVREAVFEAARLPSAEHVRAIHFTHPIHMHTHKKPTIVLTNLAATADCKSLMEIQLLPSNLLHTLYSQEAVGMLR